MLFSKSANKPFPWCVRAQKEREILCIFKWNTDYHWSIFSPERQPFPKQHFAWPFPITDQINPANWKSFNFSIISFRPGRPTWFMDAAHEWVFSVGCRALSWNLQICLRTAKRIAKFSVNLQLIILWISTFFISPFVFRQFTCMYAINFEWWPGHFALITAV